MFSTSTSISSVLLFDVCVFVSALCSSSPFLSQRRLSALNRPPFRSAKPHGRLPAPQGPLFCRSRHGCAAPGPRRQNPGAWIPVSHRSFRAPPARSSPAPRHGYTSAGPGSAQAERLKRRLSVQPPGLKSLLRFPLFVLYCYKERNPFPPRPILFWRRRRNRLFAQPTREVVPFLCYSFHPPLGTIPGYSPLCVCDSCFCPDIPPRRSSRYILARR